MSKKMVSYERETPLPDWVTPGVLHAMHNDGQSLRKIAARFGVSYETIRQLIKKAKANH